MTSITHFIHKIIHLKVVFKKNLPRNLNHFQGFSEPKTIQLRTEHDELQQIREDVTVQLTEIDIEEFELRAEIAAMEMQRDELQSQNHANNVTQQAPKPLFWFQSNTETETEIG